MDFNIVTYHGNNYGATLQAFAMQNFLIENGYSAGIFNYKKNLASANKKNLKASVSSLIGKITKSNRALEERKIKFKTFHDEYFNLNESNDCSVFLAGSDQIWNATRNLDPMFFLQFVDDDKYKASYAASMGVSRISDNNEETFFRYLNSFDSVSVREQDAKDCIEKEYSGEINVNIDPTLLHNKEFYLKIAQPVEGIPEHFVIAYILHVPANINQLVKWLKLQTGYPVVLIDTTGAVAYIVKHDIVLHNVGPAEFLWLFSKADIVITTSFHGTAFSLIFKKEFYSIINHASPSRISNLASKCGFQVVRDDQTSFDRLDNLDWGAISEVIEIEQRRSKEYIDQVYANAQNKKKKRLTGNVLCMTNKCTGCAACGSVCPVGAIKMILNNDGFYEPYINESICINCGKCANKCPVNHKTISSRLKSFYGWSKDSDVVFNSSSGGAFWALANTISSNGGTVIGAVYSEDYNSIVFKSSDDVSIETMRKSKYSVSQSDTIYDKVRSALEQGRRVFFCGAPCQCAGLQSVFGDNNDNLILCDFVCGGMPSLAFYREHLQKLKEIYHAEIVGVDFRPKKWGWGKYRICVKFNNGKEYIKRDYQDSYFCCFSQKKVSVRISCQECPYRYFHRSDITIADYWGYKAGGQIKHKEGMSLLVANTKKGLECIQSIENFDLFELEEMKTRYAFVPKALEKKKVDEHNRFFKTANEIGFEKAANQLYTFSKANRAITWLSRKKR